MSTGYTQERAAPHEVAVAAVLAELNNRGYPCAELPVDGHRPDAKLIDGDYIEVKTGHPSLVIELDSLHEYQRIETIERHRVYIVHAPAPDPSTWQVHTPASLNVRGGPRRRSGSGSLDDWYRCDAHGTRFVDYFPATT